MLESESPLDAPELWIRAGFHALAAHIAVLDAQGTIVAVNAAWERFGRAHQAPPFVWTGVGLNYLDVCRRATDESPEAEEALRALGQRTRTCLYSKGYNPAIRYSGRAEIDGDAELSIATLPCRALVCPADQSYGFSTRNPSIGVKCWRFRVDSGR